MHCQTRIEEIVASLREDAAELGLTEKDRAAVLALAEHVRKFAPPAEVAASVIDEEAELHGVHVAEMRPTGHRSRREVTQARYAVVRRLGAMGLSTRKIAALLGYRHHGPIALILTHQREAGR
jgi:hypothetical protein